MSNFQQITAKTYIREIDSASLLDQSLSIQDFSRTNMAKKDINQKHHDSLDMKLNQSKRISMPKNTSKRTQFKLNTQTPPDSAHR